MPPKKKPEKKKEPDDEPAGYNIGIMNIHQLRQHAVLLQNEIEAMRKHCSFYQKMEDELVELLRVAEDDLRHSEDEILSKNVDLEKLKLKFLKHLREKKQWPKYMEHSASVRKEKLSSEIDNRLQQEQDRHLVEKERLNALLQQKGRELEAMKVKIEMARRETKELNERHLTELNDQQKSMLEQAIDRFDSAKKETLEDFKQAKQVIEAETREGKIRSEKSFIDACETFKQKLHNYYLEVTQQDLDAIKQLKQKIKKVEENISSSQLKLQNAQKENNLLKQSQSIVATRRDVNLTEKFQMDHLHMIEALKVHNRIEKIALENQNLEKQIKDVTEKINDLRRQFTTALSKVRDTTEMKPAILERKLNFILDKKNSAQESTDTEIENESSEYTTTEDDTSESTITEDDL